MGLLEVAQAILNLEELERCVMAEELMDRAGTEHFTLVGTDETITIEEVAGGLLIWAEHVQQNSEEG